MNRTSVEEALAPVRRGFRSHGGSVDFDTLTTDGDLRLRFGGLCSGCPSKAMCLEHTVRPALQGLSGVRTVQVVGGRVSVEAEQRLRGFLGTSQGDPAEGAT